MRGSIYIRNTQVKVTDILDMIGNGYMYNSILYKYPGLSITDIMAAANFAKLIIEEMVNAEEEITVGSKIEIIAHGKQIINLTKLRKTHPKAFEKWTSDEDAHLIKLYHKGEKTDEISIILQRQKEVIITRLKELELMK